MLLQTNAYSLPRDKQDQHSLIVKRFEDSFSKLGASFEVYQQVSADFSDTSGGSTLRFVQIMKFKDLAHLEKVRQAELADPACRQLVADFCDLVDYAAQLGSGSYLPGYYASLGTSTK